MSGIEKKYINAPLVVGSSDILRNNIGGYWTPTIDDNGNNEFQFTSVDLSSINQQYITKIYSQPEIAQEIDEALLLPNFTYPIRIAASGDSIVNDEHWKAIAIGGSWGNKTYAGLFNSLVFEYFNIDYGLPYSKLDSKYLEGEYITNVAEISYDYRQYLEQFQLSIQTNTSELLLPNYYLLADLTRWGPSDVVKIENSTAYNNEAGVFGPISYLYPNEWLNFVSIDENYENIYSLFDFNEQNVAMNAVPKYIKKDLNNPVRNKNTNFSVDYLPNVYSRRNYELGTSNWATNKLQHMLFDYEAAETFSNMLPYHLCMPYYTKILMQQDPLLASSVFANSIIENNFSSKFIKTLYRCFNNNIEDLLPEKQSFGESTGLLSSSAEAVNQINNIDTNSYRQIDYTKFLIHCHNNFNTSGENDNCVFVGENNLARLSAIEESDTYRFFNTETTLAVLNDAVDFVENKNNVNMDTLQDLFDEKVRHTETLAYRVEKVANTPTGDQFTTSALQNFWFMNNGKEFNFYDTQVKYDQGYTYNVYAYVLAVGIRYRFSDPILSRNLGCEDDDKVGLEFYDINTSETTDEKFSSDPFSGAATQDDFIPRYSEIPVEFHSQIFSKYPYLADCDFSYEPVLKLFEIPIISKTIKVLDNPGNSLTVSPYQLIGTNRRIGFDFFYGTFELKKFPSVIIDDDIEYREDYYSSNDLLPDEEITSESVSPASEIQIYRLSNIPESLTDFDGNLYNTVNLVNNEQPKYTYNFTSFVDDVVTNKKYYYLFRAMTRAGEISHQSLVYEIQLIDDGGYFYSIINTFNEEDLKVKPYETVSRQFKKLIHLQPNLSQVQLNFQNADFTENAPTQVTNVTVGNAEDLIWDKTFKIRLTSRKTGKKIDFNVTYKLKSD
jgi:hypothetical protein